MEVLKEDKTSLAGHHIYGSLRLSIQRYITGQKGFDALSTTSTGGAIQALAQKRAGYSMWGGDLFAIPTYINTGQSQPMGTASMEYGGIGIQAHILGNCHYELTNHS